MKRASVFQHVRRFGPVLLGLILVFGSGATVLACSGRGAVEAIEHNYSVVVLCAITSAALLSASVGLFFLRKKKGLWVVVVSALLLVFHPVWFYGGGGGDCGMSMASGAMFTTVLIGVGAAHQLRSWLVR